MTSDWIALEMYDATSADVAKHCPIRPDPRTGHHLIQDPKRVEDGATAKAMANLG